jgi:hypothetical protein
MTFEERRQRRLEPLEVACEADRDAVTAAMKQLWDALKLTEAGIIVLPEQADPPKRNAQRDLWSYVNSTLLGPDAVEYEQLT